MTYTLEEEQCIEKENNVLNIKDIPLKQDAGNSSKQKNKRPEWHKRSPIQDVFVRYGEYFS